MAATGQSWGRYPRAEHVVHAMTDRHASLPAFDGTALPHGNGRSYGDSCLNPNGSLLRTRGMDRFIAFDAATGVLRCEAGVLLGEILDQVVPQGWFLPVSPGTRHVTVGGAIANDVHGKNHHAAGTFGHHVEQFELLRSDGARVLCTPGDAHGLFAATVGGLGLTGVITWAQLRLRRIHGPWMETETLRFGSLDEFFALSRASAADHEYTVAWIDCLARGPSLGRGLFMRANHAPACPELRPAAPRERWAMPFTPPFSLVNRLTLRPFNALYYRRQRAAARRDTVHYAPYFYPLDGIRNWNRMYGPRGFLQYQCVLPPAAARDGIAALMREIAASGSGSFLAVLKEFGTRESLGMLSFPRPGTTLALDFPNDGAAVFALLDRLDRIVDAADGAVYPAKDARLGGASFRRAFPNWERFADFVDPRFSSGFWRRVMENPCNES
jgi:FAD/FMN-containing dehydrogenase